MAAPRPNHDSLEAFCAARPAALPAEVAVDRIPELLGESERLRAILWARRALRINRPAPTEDRLLVITDAASRLGVSKDWLNHHAGRMPFTEGSFGSERRGIDRCIASRVGHHRR